MESKDLEAKRLIGQGYDGAVPFSGKNTGVQDNAYLFWPCILCPLLLQLASIQAADCVPQIKKFFGMQLSPWKEVQSVLNLPELRVIKPSNTHWLSHERCIKSIRKELPAIILTLQELYESKKHLEFSPFCQVSKEFLQPLS